MTRYVVRLDDRYLHRLTPSEGGDVRRREFVWGDKAGALRCVASTTDGERRTALEAARGLQDLLPMRLWIWSAVEAVDE